MVRVSCALCGSPEAEHLIRAGDYEGDIKGEFDVSRCRECGYIYTSTRPDESVLFEICYPDDYICFNAGKGSSFGQMLDRFRVRGQMLQRIKHLKRHIGGDRRIRMLEIGCGRGSFLSYCRDEERYDVTGIEVNKKMCAVLKEKDIDVINANFEDVDLTGMKFDVVCMFHVLEHVWDAVQSLKRINTILNDGGILYLELPNYDTPARKLFDKYWFNYHQPRHLTHFDRKTMERAAHESGFKVVSDKGEFRPTINAISLQYYVQNNSSSDFLKKVFSANNPLMIMFGVFTEIAFAAMGKLSTMTVILKKERDYTGSLKSKMVETSI